MTDKESSFEWCASLLRRSADYCEEVRLLHRISVRAIAQAKASAKLMRALTDHEGDDTEEDKRRLAEMEEDVVLAQKEIEKGFSTVNAQAVVALWAGLETFVEDLVVLWLLNIPETLSNEAFSKIKVPFAQFATMDAEEQMNFLVKEMIRQRNADLKAGVGRFEEMVAAIGLDGAVDRETKDALYEFSQVRNLIVHRTGLADYRFKKACPWFDVEVGKPLLISRAMYNRYLTAAYTYPTILAERVNIKRKQTNKQGS